MDIIEKPIENPVHRIKRRFKELSNGTQEKGCVTWKIGKVKGKEKWDKTFHIFVGVKIYQYADDQNKVIRVTDCSGDLVNEYKNRKVVNSERIELTLHESEWTDETILDVIKSFSTEGYPINRKTFPSKVVGKQGEEYKNKLSNYEFTDLANLYLIPNTVFINRNRNRNIKKFPIGEMIKLLPVFEDYLLQNPGHNIPLIMEAINKGKEFKKLKEEDKIEIENYV